MAECDAVRHAQLRAEVRDHTYYMVFPRPEMEAAVSALGETAHLPLELCEQPVEPDAPRGEHTEVAVHGQDVLVLRQRLRHAHRDGLLPDAAEPLADAPLPQ
jgi:hypothetical protein